MNKKQKISIGIHLLNVCAYVWVCVRKREDSSVKEDENYNCVKRDCGFNQYVSYYRYSI